MLSAGVGQEPTGEDMCCADTASLSVMSTLEISGNWDGVKVPDMGIVTGVAPDGIAYWYSWGHFFKLATRLDRETPRFQRTTYRISKGRLSRFGDAQIFDSALSRVLERVNGAVRPDPQTWTSQPIQLSTLMMCAMLSFEDVDRVIKEPHICGLCAFPENLYKVSFSSRFVETTDTMPVWMHVEGACFDVTRRVYWNYSHDSNLNQMEIVHPTLLSHRPWLWDHPHGFVYTGKAIFSHPRAVGKISRLELDCLVEVERVYDKLRTDVKNRIRMRSLYRFPGPPKRLKEMISEDVWNEVACSLLLLCSGLRYQKDIPVKQILQTQTFADFSKRLALNVLTVDVNCDLKTTDGDDDHGYRDYLTYTRDHLVHFGRCDDDSDEDIPIILPVPK
jgi:hypothetical protein